MADIFYFFAFILLNFVVPLQALNQISIRQMDDYHAANFNF